MARFFIDRPVFAMVIAIVIVILGSVAIPGLPISAYPQVVPPSVQVTATYLGGNAQDLEKTVAQPIEEQLVGLDGMLYYQSTMANNGQMVINITFKLGTNPDIAAVQTQNRVNVALPRLPPEVQRQGVIVKKVSTAFLMAVGLVSSDDRYDALFLTNYAQINLVNQIGSLPGVGESRLSSQQVYSMRVWLNPDKMTKLGITATDVSNAVQAQNRQNPAGAIGQAPSPRGTDFQYAVTAPGRLTDPSQFEDIVVRAQPDASLVRVRDIGRVELGAQTYSGFSRLNGRPSANVIVYLAPGANAVETADQVIKFVNSVKPTFPPGIDYVVPYNSTMFVRAAIKDVLVTLMEAIGLVILVVFIFLQNWRATLIPLLTVPVAVVGTFAVFPLLGFSINITSMFGLVLAIGIVVDDAIVVVEAVQRHIDDGMSPKDATVQAMSEVSAPVVAIAFILAAVFIPVAFIGGISGEIYKQFALTIAVSVLLSAFSALSLSPALAALLLRPHKKSASWLSRPFQWFNDAFGWTTNRYLSVVTLFIRRVALPVLLLGAVSLLAVGLFKRLPAGFLPNEDQGAFFVSMRLPDGASTDRADAAARKIESVMGKLPGVDKYFVLGGLDIATGTSNSNVATVIATLTPWDDRTSKQTQLDAILGAAQRGFAQVPEAFTFAFGLPPILGLSPTGGFQFMLEDRAGGDIAGVARAADLLTAAARKRPELGTVISTFRPSVPGYSIDMDTDKLQTMGISLTDAYNTLQTFLGGLYVNDFNQFGHTWQVLLQAEPEFRDQPSSVGRFYVRNSTGGMVPLSTLATITPSGGPDVVYRYNRFRAIQLLGTPAPGYSSGQASSAMEEVANTSLPQGFGYEWTGTTYQEKQAQGNEGAIFGFAAVLVFLFLAALYESWSIPFAVLFALPLGMFGALAGVYLRSYPYDIYTQIGIVTLIGLAAKNAILIVEFAKESHEQGKSVRDAAIEAAHLRLRPILMTSFAFILGVLPLVLASGASSGARRSLGTAVFSGMLSATLLAIFIVPVLYVMIESFVERRRPSDAPAAIAEAARMKRTIAAISVLALTGCTMGPNYKRPQVALPGQFRSAPTGAADPGASIADTKWQDLFSDQTLNQMVTTAFAHNFDLRIAAERVEQARSQLGITRANQYPFVSAQANFTAARNSSLAVFPVPAGTTIAASYTSLGAALSWELDIWGRLRRLTEAARANYLASEEGRRAVGVSLVSDVMESYFQLLEQDLELEISRKTLELARNSFNLVELRRQRGAASGLDVSQAEQLIHTASAQIAAAERTITQSENLLSLLQGSVPAPQARGRKLEEIQMPAQLPPGLPSALLERRPDIREAEQNLVAANAQIGAARALYFPQLSLSAFVGGQSRRLFDLASSPGRVYTVAPAAVQSIFNAGQIRSQVRLSEAQQRELLIAYQRSIYSAMREISDALVSFDKLREQRSREEQLVRTLEDTMRLSELRYRGGLDSYLQVLDAQRNLFIGQLSLAQLRLQERVSVVQLYRALGGGWS